MNDKCPDSRENAVGEIQILASTYTCKVWRQEGALEGDTGRTNAAGPRRSSLVLQWGRNTAVWSRTTGTAGVRWSATTRKMQQEISV